MDNTNFSSLDRLLEFGVGMGLANQMIDLMNRTMKTMQIPSTALPITSSTQWYFGIEEKACGPFSLHEIRQLFLDGKIDSETLSWTTGLCQWQKVKDVPELINILQQLPPAL